MWGEMKQLAKKIIFGPPPQEEDKDKLSEASKVLSREADRLNREVQIVGRREDPIEVIIRNIKRAQRR